MTNVRFEIGIKRYIWSLNFLVQNYIWIIARYKSKLSPSLKKILTGLYMELASRMSHINVAKLTQIVEVKEFRVSTIWYVIYMNILCVPYP